MLKPYITLLQDLHCLESDLAKCINDMIFLKESKQIPSHINKLKFDILMNDLLNCSVAVDLFIDPKL